MYKIIGTDQKEYGPVSAQQIIQWIAQGRLNAQSKAQSEGGEWKPLGTFPEFASLFAPRAASPAATFSPASPPSTFSPAAPAPKTSGLAIASLVLGLCGLITCGVASLVGLILGIVAMSQIKKSNGALTGGGLALAGTIVSGVFLLIFPLFLVASMASPAFTKARDRAQAIQCINNMHQLAVATEAYAAEHNGHLPPATNWCDAIKPNAGSDSVFRCPSADKNDRCDYAFNARLDGMDEKDINPYTVLYFETDNSWNAHGGPELMPRKWRHSISVNVAFADGRVERISIQRIAQLRWNP